MFIQEYINSNANGVQNEDLRKLASSIEIGTEALFKELNDLMALKC